MVSKKCLFYCPTFPFFKFPSFSQKGVPFFSSVSLFLQILLALALQTLFLPSPPTTLKLKPYSNLNLVHAAPACIYLLTLFPFRSFHPLLAIHAFCLHLPLPLHLHLPLPRLGLGNLNFCFCVLRLHAEMKPLLRACRACRPLRACRACRLPLNLCLYVLVLARRTLWLGSGDAHEPRS